MANTHPKLRSFNVFHIVMSSYSLDIYVFITGYSKYLALFKGVKRFSAITMFGLVQGRNRNDIMESINYSCISKNLIEQTVINYITVNSFDYLCSCEILSRAKDTKTTHAFL